MNNAKNILSYRNHFYSNKLTLMNNWSYFNEKKYNEMNNGLNF